MLGSSPVSEALGQYKFRSYLKGHVVDLEPSKRVRGVFTVVFVSDATLGGTQVSVQFLEATKVEEDEYGAAFLSSDPRLRTWLSEYDVGKEFLVAAAFTYAGAVTPEQQAQQRSQMARLTFAQLRELDQESYEARVASENQQPSNSFRRARERRRQIEELD